MWNIERLEPTIGYEITLKTGGTVYGKIAMADENATAIEVQSGRMGEPIDTDKAWKSRLWATEGRMKWPARALLIAYYTIAPLGGAIGLAVGAKSLGCWGGASSAPTLAPSQVASVDVPGAIPVTPGVQNIKSCPGCTINQIFPPNTDFESLRLAMRELAAELQKAPATPNPYAVAHPGFSIGMVLSLSEPIGGRNNFVLDIGMPDRAVADRISLYVDSDRHLQFRVIGDDAKAHYVTVTRSFRTFRFNALMYLVCEYGVLDSDANPTIFMRVLIDGREAGYVEERPTVPPFLRDIDPHTVDTTLGADVKGENGGPFAASELRIETGTLTTIQLNDRLAEVDASAPPSRCDQAFGGGS